MSKLKYDWSSSSNIIDDVGYHDEDARIFRDLLGRSEKDDTSNVFHPSASGNVLKGRIVEITKDFILIDVGLKSEGLVPIEECTDSSEIFIGNTIEAFLDQSEGEDGQIVLSCDKARRLRQWENIVKNCSEGSIVTGKVLRKVKGGLIVDIGVEAFLPGSQIDNKRIKNLDEYLEKTFDFKILKINTERKNIVVSRRELLEEERMTKKVEILENFHEGEIRHGIVKNITDFGVFLDVDGVDGLLHITDMTWKRIKHPSEMVQLGDNLEVVIIDVNKEKGRIALGMKQRVANPWETIEKRYPVGMRVRGRVAMLLPYGFFVEIEPGIEGFVHFSEISWTKTIADPSEAFQVGDEVEAIILSIQKEEGKISLGMKQLEKNPWDEVEARYCIGSRINVEIRDLTNFGAFVDLEPGIDGLIYTSDMSWLKKVSHPSEVFKKGDKVDVLILSIDKENKRVVLGVKQLDKNPWENLEDLLPIGSLVTGIVSKITAFGAFVVLDNGLEGLIHVTELSDQPFGKVEEVISKGQKIIAKVIKIDPERRTVSLSIKEYLVEKNQVNRDDIVVGEKKKRATKKTTKKTTTADEES